MHTIQTQSLADIKELRKEVDLLAQSANTWYKIYSKLNDKFKVGWPDI